MEVPVARNQETGLHGRGPARHRLSRLQLQALGLLAAIPAVIFYNKLSTDSDRIIAGYEAFADEFATILSRQLDA